MKQLHFQSFLRLLRRAYRERSLWLLLDEAPCHIAPRSQALARHLNIELLWLPKQCSELNAMDQLWREMKGSISANYQYSTIGTHVAFAQAWLLSLTDTEAKRKAGIFSKDFWLQSFFKWFLLTHLAAYGKSARRAIDQTDELGDKDTADIFTEISRGVDKYLWFVEAHLG
jgi:DDE superfamily endonuclease